MDLFEKHLKLEKELINLTEKAIREFDSKGQIEVLDEQQQIIKTQYLLFLKFTSQFFIRRASFITKIVLDNKFNEDEKGIVKTLLRGLIEIIAKREYAKANKDLSAKNYLWEQLKGSLLSLYLSVKNGQKNLIIPKEAIFWHKDLQVLGTDLLDLEELIEKYIKCQLSILSPNDKGKQYLKIEKKLNFPGTKELINKYWIDQKPFKKRDAYMWYRILSNQIHASLLFEGYEVKTIDFQLLSFLIMLHWKFLYSVKEELSKNLQNEIDKEINNIKKNAKDFTEAWKIKKTITHR